MSIFDIVQPDFLKVPEKHECWTFQSGTEILERTVAIFEHTVEKDSNKNLTYQRPHETNYSAAM